MKEIECISEFLYEIEKNGVMDVDDKIFKKLEYIRDNYNKILLNIQKMIASSPIMKEMREKYDKNKSSLTEERYSNTNTNNNDKNRTKDKETIGNENKEWIDKLNNDVDNLNKASNYTNKKPKNNSTMNTINYSNADKDLDSLVNNFQQNVNGTKYRTTNPRTRSANRSNNNSSNRNKSNTMKSQRHRNLTPPETGKTPLDKINTNTILNSHRITYDSVKMLGDEVQHIKDFCLNLKRTVEENCILENEKKNFEKIKNENIKINADLTIMKEDIKEILGNYHNLVKRVNFLEEENANLRKHNKNLVRFISQHKTRGGNIQIQDQQELLYPDNVDTNPVRLRSNNNNNINVDYSSPLFLSFLPLTQFII